MKRYINVQAIHDFNQDWKRKKDQQAKDGGPLSLDMSFYTNTFQKLKEFKNLIDKLPATHVKLNSILLETNTLKKYLQDIPLQINGSIRSNITSTMEISTKQLRDDLSGISEILDQFPTDIDKYMLQVNALKSLTQQKPRIDNSYETIKLLKRQCRQDNIRLALSLDMEINQAEKLYENLDKLTENARNNLKNLRNDRE